MLKTPDLGHLSDSDLEDVYEPAEDSFLFLDALEMEMSALRDHLSPAVSLEVGCGSGVISCFLAMHLRRPCHFICTDLNPLASEASRQTCERNSILHGVDCVTCDLADPLLTRLGGTVDLLLFNPPYVVTPSDEVAATPIATAWAGGLKGREVIDRFLPSALQLLSPRGWFYLLLCTENQPDEVYARVAKLGGLGHQVVASRRAGNERLQVVRFSRNLASSTTTTSTS